MALSLIYLGIRLIMKYMHNAKHAGPVVVKQVSQQDVQRIKGRYISELSRIENELIRSRMSVREAYQRMSECIRGFVFDVTGIRVQNYTLQDIQELNIPILSELIVEYYAPEFAQRSKGNVNDSINKTKWVIERWN